MDCNFMHTPRIHALTCISREKVATSPRPQFWKDRSTNKCSVLPLLLLLLLLLCVCQITVICKYLPPSARVTIGDAALSHGLMGRGG